MEARNNFTTSFVGEGVVESLSELYNNKHHWQIFINSVDFKDILSDKKHYYLIAHAFKAGRDIEQNLKLAAYFYFLAAKYNSNDKPSAFSYLQSLTDKPSAQSEAYYYLSLCFESGYQTVKNEHKAFLALEKAAELNNPQAHQKLGTYYQFGFNDRIRININKAITHYYLALEYCNEDNIKFINSINLNLMKIVIDNAQSFFKNKELIFITFCLKSYYMTMFSDAHEHFTTKHADKLNSTSHQSRQVKIEDEELHEIYYLSPLSELIKDHPNVDKVKSLLNACLDTELGKAGIEYLHYVEIIAIIADQLKDPIARIKQTLTSHLCMLEKKSVEITTIRSMSNILNQMDTEESLSILQTAVSLLKLAEKSKIVGYYIEPLNQVVIHFEKPNSSIKNTEEIITHNPSLELSQPKQSELASTSLTAACARLLPPPPSRNPIKPPTTQMRPFK